MAVTSAAAISVQSLQESLIHFIGPIWDQSKWFVSDKHAQLTADAYDIIVMMVNEDYSNVMI